jgi:hypothetical protein
MPKKKDGLLMHCGRANVLAAAGLLSLGCESHPGKGPVSESTLPIVGGNLATTCVWPTAIMLVGPEGCSGTLVHPRVVVTAKHCLVDGNGNPTPPASIGLGETRDQWARTVAVSRCFTHPDHDVGVCTLTEDVTGIPIVPVMAPCEMTELAAGKPVVEVGFGITSATGRTYGAKKWINATIESAGPDQVDIDVTTGSQEGEYYGDSGGPLFFEMPDRSWRLIGEDCCSPAILGSGAPRVSTYKSVPYHVAWAEKQSGIDLTPCHDANGWNPTAACTGFPTNPGVGVGAWATLCQGESMLRQPTCQDTLPSTDAGGEHAEADADAGGRDGARDGPVDANLRDSYASDSEVDIDGDGDTGWADGHEDAATIRDSGGMGGATGSGEAGADAPEIGPDSSVGRDTGGSGGAGGSSAGGSGSESDGSAGAGGSSAGGGGGESDGSAGGKTTANGARDGGGETASSDGTTGLGGTSGWDGGSGSDVTGGQDGPAASASDGTVDQKATRASGSGCACRSVSGRDSGAWPGLLALGLVATRLIRRRARLRGRFVV